MVIRKLKFYQYFLVLPALAVLPACNQITDIVSPVHLQASTASSTISGAATSTTVSNNITVTLKTSNGTPVSGTVPQISVAPATGVSLGSC